MSQNDLLGVFLYDKLNEILTQHRFTELGLIVSHQSISHTNNQPNDDDEDYSWLPSNQSVDDLPDDVIGSPYHVNVEEGALGVAMWAIPRLFKQSNKHFRISRQRLNDSIDQSKNQPPDQLRNTIDPSIIQSVIQSTRILLMINADHQSAWNARKRILISRLNDVSINGPTTQSTDQSSNDPIKPSTEQSISLLNDELQFVSLIQSKHVKSGETWHHRLWCVKEMMEVIYSIYPIIKQTNEQPDSPATDQSCNQASSLLSSLICTELSLIERSAERYPKLYYAWNHRLFLLQTMDQSINHTSNQSINQLFSDQISSEWSSVTRWNDRHLSDHSGWWFRYQLLVHTKAKDHQLTNQQTDQLDNSSINSSNDQSDVQPAPCPACQSISEEFHYISDLIDRCPGHESLWKYRRYLSFLTLESIHLHHSFKKIESSFVQLMESLRKESVDLSVDGTGLSGEMANHRYNSTTDETRMIMEQFLKDEADWCNLTTGQAANQTSDAHDLRENNRWALAHQSTLTRRMQLFM